MNKKKVTTTKNNKKQLNIKRRKINFNLLLIVAFCVGLITIYVTYAWFSSSLNATVEFVKFTVNRETGLYISLDGETYGSEIVVTQDDVINGISDVYENHNNKWVPKGLIPTSSIGKLNPNDEYFTFFQNEVLNKGDGSTTRRYLDTFIYDEVNEPASDFIAFDIFLKNISNSNISDNLYLDEGTGVYLNEGYEADIPGLFNSLRIGFSTNGFTDDVRASADVYQNLECDNNCYQAIYEPNSTAHSYQSIGRVGLLGIDMEDGEHYPTYAVIAEGKGLYHDNGHGNIPLDTEYFEEQETITDIENSLFEIPHGVTKVRVYIWIEGQDLDNLESYSTGGSFNVTLNLRKDYAGYGL